MQKTLPNNFIKKILQSKTKSLNDLNIKCILLVPRLRDHSNKDLKNEDFSSIAKFSTPLKVQLFLSLHIAHIKHKGAIFQAKELPCFANQFFHPKTTPTTLPDVTQCTTNIEDTGEIAQCTNKWYTVSPLHLYMQHYLTSIIPLL